MAFPKLNDDLYVISKLGTNPGADDGLSEEQFKAKFDEAANVIKDYLNNILVPELDNIADLDAMLEYITDKLRDVIDAAVNTVNEHIADMNNPHGVTPAQIGAVTAEQVNTMINDALGVIENGSY